jgi:hypothetical protein
MAEYQHRSRTFGLRGIRLSRPADLLGEEIYSPFLQKARTYQGYYSVSDNLRGYVDGTISTRPGAALINAAAMPAGAVHSLKELNDDVGPLLSTPTQAYAVFAGAGTKLYADVSTHDAFTEIASGLSGNPLTYIAHRPEQSPQPWLYVHDANKMIKAKASAAADATKSYQWGIAAPVVPLGIALGAPIRKVIDDCEAGTFGGWAASAGALTNEDRVAAVAITYILFDVSNTGWACVNPAAIGEIREGMDLTTSASAETVTVDSVHKAITATTIGSIKYDSGTSGLCTIQLAAPTAELEMDSMLRIAAAENVRVLSVTYGPDGIPSFRCSTTGTRVAGDAVAGLASFRAYFVSNHAAAETLSGKMLKEVTAAAGITTLTRTVALDLSTFGTRPVLPSDLMVVEMTIDNPSLVTEIQIQLDVDASMADFTHNYYFKSISPSDLTPLVQQTLGQLTVQQRVLQRDEIRLGSGLAQKLNQLNLDTTNDVVFPGDILSGGLIADGTPAPDQAATGASQWSVIKIPISELLAGRVGSDTSRGLKDVAKIRISINATAIVTVQVDSWYITGSYGADSVLPNSSGGGVSPYYWIYRYRDSRTGAASAWSPINRNGFSVSRNRITLTPTASSDSQVDKIDYARLGGTLNTFHIIGTGPNSGSFNDDFPDDVAQIGQPVTQEDIQQTIQPFPVVDIPRSGTCDVKGTEVIWKTGDKFNTAAVQANQIVINNIPYHLYTNPQDDQHLSLSENAGTQTGVSFFIADATLGGQVLDAVFGPYGGGDQAIVFFGVRQGVLYWTMGNNPDLCRIDNQVEVTGGSETLMNGIIYGPNAQPILFSNQRIFEIVPDGQGGFAPKLTFGGKGLFARWGLCAGPAIYFIGEDGIYESKGGEAVKISADLGPLLPHDGQVGIAVNGINPPDFTKPEKMRLEFTDNKVKWSFLDTGSAYRTWVYDVLKEGWESRDTYAFGASCHYHVERHGTHQELIGGSDGKVYLSGGTTDNAIAISGHLRTGAEDFGETRTQKQFGDVQIDLNTGGVNVTATILADNYSTSLTPETINTAVRTYYKSDINAGAGIIATNLAIDLTWTGYVVFYEWNPSFILRTDIAIKRATDWFVFPGTKYVRGLVIEADTLGVSRSVKIQADGVDTGITLTVNHSGQVSKPYGFVPFTAHSVRLLPTDTNPWLFFEITKWEFDDYPELQTIYTSILDQEKPGDKYIRGLLLETDTANAVVSVGIWADGVLANTISVQANGRSERDFTFAVPFFARMVQLIPATPIRIFRQIWTFDDYPLLNALITAWDDAGYEGAKFVQGMVLEADTNNLPVVLQVQGDQGALGATVTATHNGRSEIAYPGAGDTWVPFVAHMLRIVPQGNVRLNPPFKVRYVFEPEPELAVRWQTQPTTHDFPNFGHVARVQVPHKSTSDITMTITVDGIDYAYIIPNSAGAYRKTFVTLKAVKGKWWEYKFTSTNPCRIYKKDVAAWGKPFGDLGPYQQLMPFGGSSRADGAAI